jgi:hypothetical protein
MDRSIIVKAVYPGLDHSGIAYEELVSVGHGNFQYDTPENDASANANNPRFEMIVSMKLINNWKTLSIFGRNGFPFNEAFLNWVHFTTKDFRKDTYNVNDHSKPHGGGWCECPSGKIYQVAKNGEQCSSGLACTNGKDLLCQNGLNSDLAYKSVNCDLQGSAIKLATSDTEHDYFVLGKTEALTGVIQNVFGEMQACFFGKFGVDENGVKFMIAVVLGKDTQRGGALYAIFDSDREIWHFKISNGTKIVYPQEYLDLMKDSRNKSLAQELMAPENLEC